MLELEWRPAAVADPVAIIDYIADDNPDAAPSLNDEIEARAAPDRHSDVDFPPVMVKELGAVAGAGGVTRQALIKMWLADKLDEHRRKATLDAAG